MTDLNNIAIRINGLSKRYRIGLHEEMQDTLTGALTDFIKRPFTNLRRLRRLSHFSDTNNGSEDIIWALKSISFTVKRGEVIGIIGRNGAGKSTLLKVLSRITYPTDGKVEIDGRVSSLLEVGTGFHQELTGRENVYLNGTILGMTKTEIDQKFEEIVEFSGVRKFIDTPVKRYSSGMQVRLAFSVAAHLEPDIMLVDEVLAVGDLQFQKKCLGKMQDVSMEGRTVFFVSHNMAAIIRLCSRVILLEDGKIIADGPASDVVAQYTISAVGASGTKVWDDLNQSPGDEGFKLTSVTVENVNGDPNSVVNVEEPVIINIGYRVMEPGLKFRVQAIFYTQGTIAFASHERVEIVRNKVGQYFSKVMIPPNLFAEGEYTLGISVFSSSGKKMHFCKVNDAVAFQVYDAITGSSARGDYSEGLGGVTRPMLDWESGLLEEVRPDS